MANSLIRAFAAVAVFSSLAGTALAADPDYCNQYAAAAIIAAGENFAHHCGYGGPRWLGNYQIHYGWCLGVPIPLAANEWHLRRAGIEKCLNH